jgi:hypothetical protein
MNSTVRVVFCALICATLALAANVDYAASLKPGKAELKSAGVLAFAPDGILLIGDPLSASVFALDTEDRKASSGAASVEIKAINEKIAGLLGTTTDQILLNDVVVNPVSKNVYVSVSRGRGPDAMPVILRVTSAGKIEEVKLDRVKHARVELPNAPAADAKDARGASRRQEAITDIAFVEGQVFVAGLSNEEFASNLRAIPFPFKEASRGTSVEIYHGNHGRFETNAPIRTFTPYTIDNKAHLLAAYTCTPLVKLPVSDLKPGSKVMGTTIAELGNRNRPADMITYKKGGKEFILLNNSSRGVMKITTEKLESYPAITAQTDIKGVPYETIADLKGVEQLDKYNDSTAILLMRGEGGALDLRTVALP